MSENVANNPSLHRKTCVCYPVGPNFNDVATLQKVSNCFLENNVIMTDRTDGQSYESKTEVLNHGFPLNHALDWAVWC